MNPLSTTELFEVWEQSLDLPLVSAAILLLGKACNTKDLSVIRRMSIGERDARLLKLREWMFGQIMNHFAVCPECKQEIEWQTKTSDLFLQPYAGSSLEENYQCSLENYEVKFRLVNSDDIFRIAKAVDSTENLRLKLLRECLIEVHRSGEKMKIDEIPSTLLDGIEKQMAIKDPQSEIQMDVNCPACGHQWSLTFDIISWFWNEINHWGQRIMQEVFLLAKFFGWSEKDILAMTPRRRYLYLKMINS